MLTEYNGQTITYDAIGNPLKYRDGMSMEWSNGRQLSSYTKGDTNVEYTYDTDGMRLTKTVDGVEHTYLYEGGLLVQETRGNEIFDYGYDANGSIRMLAYRETEDATPTYFYYALNTRGDVIALYNSDGNLTAKYTYDAWGNEVSVTYPNGVEIPYATHIASLSYVSDVDRDGERTVMDATAIQKKLAKIEI